MKRTVLLLGIAGMLAVMVSTAAVLSGSEELKTVVGYAFLGLAFVLAGIAYAYAFVRGRKEKREDLTSESEIILSRIEVRLDAGLKELKSSVTSGVNDLKSHMLFGIGAMLALGISIFSMV